MRDHLIAFIKDVQKAGKPGNYPLFTIRRSAGDGPSLVFGFGYFQPTNVLFSSGQDRYTEEMSVEDGVDAFLQAYGLGAT